MWTALLNKIGHDEAFLNIFGTAFVANLTFFGLGALYAWFDFGKISWIKKYKVQPGTNDSPEKEKFINLVKQVVINQTIVQIPTLFVFYQMTVWRNRHFKPLLVSEQYEVGTLPEFHWALIEFAVFLVAEEFAFYYSHRLAHHKKLYKHIHKKHHEWTSPVGLTALYAHPVEHVISNMFPVFLGPLICGSHILTGWVWMAVAIANTINAHSGYHFPFFPSPEAHDFHHLKFNQCYGVLGLLDYLHSTDVMFRSNKAYERHIMLTTTTPMLELIPDNETSEKFKRH